MVWALQTKNLQRNRTEKMKKEKKNSNVNVNSTCVDLRNNNIMPARPNNNNKKKTYIFWYSYTEAHTLTHIHPNMETICYTVFYEIRCLHAVRKFIFFFFFFLLKISRYLPRIYMTYTHTHTCTPYMYACKYICRYSKYYNVAAWH